MAGSDHRQAIICLLFTPVSLCIHFGARMPKPNPNRVFQPTAPSPLGEIFCPVGQKTRLDGGLDRGPDLEPDSEDKGSHVWRLKRLSWGQSEPRSSNFDQLRLSIDRICS